MDTSRSLLILCACPDHDSALAIADALLKLNFAACVTIQDQATSLYRWQGKIERATESLLAIKTTVSRYKDVEAAILQRHPYQLPEIIGIPIIQGLTNYLTWIEQCTELS